MKIIRVDNFDREHVADKLVVENVNEYYGKRIVDLLNSKESKNSPDFYKLVEDDYKLWRGIMEELV